MKAWEASREKHLGGELALGLGGGRCGEHVGKLWVDSERGARHDRTCCGPLRLLGLCCIKACQNRSKVMAVISMHVRIVKRLQKRKGEPWGGRPWAWK